jgi:hypothetical protein
MTSKSTRFIQGGLETTKGTEADATWLWRGTGVFDDQLTLEAPPEDIGYYVNTDRTYIPKTLGQLNFDSVPATFQQLPYLFAAGVENITSGVLDGAGSDYIYQYDFPVTSAPTIKTYTLEMGNSVQEYQMLYSFVRSFSLTGAPGEALMCSSTWNGRQIATGTKTAAVGVPSVEEILFSKGKLYIDDVSGTIGSTQVSSAFYGMDFTVDTGWFPLFTADGNIYFTEESYNRDNLNVNLGITFQFASDAVNQSAAWRAETAKQIRVIFEGSAFTAAGTDYSNHTLILDLAGYWDRFEPMTDADGNDIIDGNFRVAYNATADVSFGQIKVVNELSALT